MKFKFTYWPVLLVALAFVASTIVYRMFQTAAPVGDIPHLSLDESAKRLLDARNEMSKWILGMSYGLLTFLLAFRYKEGNNGPRKSPWFTLICGLLILSLYGAFLFQDSVVFSLSKGPIYQLYGPVVSFPLLLQFWTFLIAVAVLATWLSRSSRFLLAFLLLLGCLREPLVAANARQSPTHTCVLNWMRDRDIPIGNSGVEMATNLVDTVARRTEQQVNIANCAYVRTILDQARWNAYSPTRSRDSGLVEYLDNVNEELLKPNWSISDLVAKLVEQSELWRAASGLLIIESKVQGSRVLINGSESGFTTLERRLVPGEFSVKVVRAGRVVFSQSNVHIQNGKECRVSVDLP